MFEQEFRTTLISKSIKKWLPCISVSILIDFGIRTQDFVMVARELFKLSYLAKPQKVSNIFKLPCCSTV